MHELCGSRISRQCGRLTCKQSGELSISRRAQRCGEAQLSRKSNGLQTGGDEIVSELVPDVAGRSSGNCVSYDSAGIGSLTQRSAMGVEHIGLLAAKEGSAQLHGAG